jgi:glycosyltransferase involved in cell wall biosynthesis
VIYKPTVSVVIPCFNDGAFLKDAVESVLAQTLQPIEILIVNDGSTDTKTLKLLGSIKSSGVEVIHQENRGLASARNTGIRKSTGDYLYFLDADDLIAPECLATLSALLEGRKDALAAASRIQLLGGAHHGKVWGQPLNPYIIRVQNQSGAGIMLRKDAIRLYDIWYDESMRSGYEDWELNIRLAKTGRDVLFCPEPLYRYRIRKRSLLSTSRKSHVEVVSYIQAKHCEHYTYESLLHAKRTHAPALLVKCEENEKASLEAWLTSQTVHDWSLEGNSETGLQNRYRLLYSSVDALQRLPAEALECSLIALETYRRQRHCVVAVRRGCSSLFATRNQIAELQRQRIPVAIVTREDAERKDTPEEILSTCDLLVEFIDQAPSSNHSWGPRAVHFSPNSLMTRLGGPELVRQRLKSVGKRILGDGFQRKCIQLYDRIYYQVLQSDEAFAVRNKVRSALGTRVEAAISSLVYGVFLTQPPGEENRNTSTRYRSLSENISTFFVAPPDDRIHLLIATAWLIEGGVEQIIFELCRLLDPSRFRVTIVTTLPSHHAWDGLARGIGASVYHLADFLKPADMAKGFLHFVLNHRVDCVFIMNSEIAYRVVKTLKRVVKWIPIIDRIEAPDPGGGYPMISAKVGKQFLDFRTVSHRGLAEYMSAKYCLPLDSIRVIHIGTNTKRIDEVASMHRGPLHEKCGVRPSTPIVLFVGRFANQKRPQVFVRCVAKIFEIDPNCNAHFAMVGDGYLMPSVTALVTKHKVNQRVHLLGAHSNAMELLRDATLLMMPSAYEGLALISYEAMALGIPQIFANVGGQSELITPETGILINNGRDEETRYAKTCLELLSDPERRARMAAAGKERIRNHFTAENAVKQYSEIFEQLAEVSRKRAAEIPHLRPPHINPLQECL